MTTQSDGISRLEGIIEAIPDRLTSIDNCINALDNRITAFESRMEMRFNWMFGLIVTTWITIMIPLIAILMRV